MNTEGHFKAFTAQLKNKIKENDSKYKTKGWSSMWK